MTLPDLPSHHALLYTTPFRKDFVNNLWEQLKTTSRANIFYDQTVIDIETSRSLISWATTPYHEHKTALLSFHIITVPAQNALLKIIEEPPTGVSFILVTSNKESLLPTLLSRVQEHTKDSEKQMYNDAELFLQTQAKDRIKLKPIDLLIKATDEEGRKDREKVRTFITTLTKVLQRKNATPNDIFKTLEIASYASDPSSSGKTLIEYLALFLPQHEA